MKSTLSPVNLRVLRERMPEFHLFALGRDKSHAPS